MTSFRLQIFEHRHRHRHWARDWGPWAQESTDSIWHTAITYHFCAWSLPTSPMSFSRWLLNPKHAKSLVLKTSQNYHQQLGNSEKVSMDQRPLFLSPAMQNFSLAHQFQEFLELTLCQSFAVSSGLKTESCGSRIGKDWILEHNL